MKPTKRYQERDSIRGLHMEALESRHLLTVGVNPGSLPFEPFDNRPNDIAAQVGSASGPSFPWCNIERPADVNGNSDVTARDALFPVNELLINGTRELPAETTPDYYLDANADEWISVLDAHVVIQALTEPADPPELANANRPVLDLPEWSKRIEFHSARDR